MRTWILAASFLYCFPTFGEWNANDKYAYLRGYQSQERDLDPETAPVILQAIQNKDVDALKALLTSEDKDQAKKDLYEADAFEYCSLRSFTDNPEGEAYFAMTQLLAEANLTATRTHVTYGGSSGHPTRIFSSKATPEKVRLLLSMPPEIIGIRPLYDMMRINESAYDHRKPNPEYSPPNRLLTLAAEVGSVDWMQALVGQGQSIIEQDQYGLSAFHYACIAAKAPAIAWLLEQGADPNQRTRFGATGVILLAQSSAPAADKIAALKLLLEKQVDLSIRDSPLGKRPICREGPDWENAPRKSATYEKNALVYAVEKYRTNDDLNFIHLLISSGMDPNDGALAHVEVEVYDRQDRQDRVVEYYNFHRTTLMDAILAKSATPALFELLIKNGAEPLRRDRKKGSNALDLILKNPILKDASAPRVAATILKTIPGKKSFFGTWYAPGYKAKDQNSKEFIHRFYKQANSK